MSESLMYKSVKCELKNLSLKDSDVRGSYCWLLLSIFHFCTFLDLYLFFKQYTFRIHCEYVLDISLSLNYFNLWSKMNTALKLWSDSRKLYWLAEPVNAKPTNMEWWPSSSILHDRCGHLQILVPTGALGTTPPLIPGDTK